jgi:hypothetical protein
VGDVGDVTDNVFPDWGKKNDVMFEKVEEN